MPEWAATRLAIKGVWVAVAALAFTALLSMLVAQTIRLEGFKLWPLSLDGWKSRAMAAEATIAEIAREQALAGEIATAKRIGKEAQYRGIAERIDDNAQDQLVAADAAAERFIAAGGVRPQAAGCPRSTAGTGTEDRDTGNPQGAGQAAQLDAAETGGDFGLPEGYVIVPADDVRICTANTIKAEAGRALAIELERASRED